MDRTQDLMNGTTANQTLGSILESLMPTHAIINATRMFGIGGLREQLCTTVGICVTLQGGIVGSLEQASERNLSMAAGLVGMTEHPFFALFEGVLPILPLDAFGVLQKYSSQVRMCPILCDALHVSTNKCLLRALPTLQAHP